MCVTNFTCICLENQVRATVSVSVLSKFGCQNILAAVCFPVFLAVFGHDLLYWELKNRYLKSPCQSLEKTSLSTVINSLISAYDSTAQDLAARVPQKSPFLDQMRVLWHNANLLELVSPDTVLKHIRKPKKARYHLKLKLNCDYINKLDNKQHCSTRNTGCGITFLSIFFTLKVPGLQ